MKKLKPFSTMWPATYWYENNTLKKCLKIMFMIICMQNSRNVAVQ